MDNFIYSNPVKMLYGKRQSDNIAKEILPYGKNILFVYGEKHLKATGMYDKITKQLKDAGIEYTDLGKIHINPRLSSVQEGIKICKEKKIDFILAVGGGSVSDAAKAIGVGAKVDYDIWMAYEDFHNIMLGNQGDFPHVPTETIPTGIVMTKPGTGSDFDYTSVLTNTETKEKLMIINKTLYPKFSILDPELTYTLQRNESMYGTADIMTHIMEQYFTPTENVDALDGFKESHLRNVIKSGKDVIANSHDYNAQSNLLYIASWACSDQNMTGTSGGWESHLIEHELTAATDLNHGHGMAIVYLGWMRYTIEYIPQKFRKFAENVWNVDTTGLTDIEAGMQGIEKTAQYWQSLGISLSLESVGIGEDVIKHAAKRAARFGNIGTVKKLDEQDVYNILKSVS